jgi:hypothetical protein
MSLTRRQFIYVTSLSAVAASASPSLLAQDEDQVVSEKFTEEGSATLAKLSLGDFEWLIGERFSISLPGQKLGKLTLIAATALDPVKPSRGAYVSGFSLRFQGAGGTLPQDTYLMQQGGLGTFPLFLVPQGPGGSNSPTYLAIFTRLAGSVSNMPITPSE